MKTAISVPAETFERADRLAAELGMNRSELFTKAAQQFIERHESSGLTEQIDAAVRLLGRDQSADDAVAAGRVRLSADDDW